MRLITLDYAFQLWCPAWDGSFGSFCDSLKRYRGWRII